MVYLLATVARVTPINRQSTYIDNDRHGRAVERLCRVWPHVGRLGEVDVARVGAGLRA